MEKIEKVVELKNGDSVVIRTMVPEDLEKSLAFFRALPAEDRAYLRTDVTDRTVVANRIAMMDSGDVLRLVALHEGHIVADGALELDRSGWKAHLGEIRLIVARSYQRLGLGMLMARELYGLAASSQVEEIVVRLMKPQTSARHIFRKLGFTEQHELPSYVKDVHGQKQDLIIGHCDLEALWREIEANHYFSDWQFRV